MLDASALETLYAPSFVETIIGTGMILTLSIIVFTLFDTIIDIINARRVPPVVGHLTKQQWLDHRHSFDTSQGTVVQWLYVRGLPPLKKEAYSPEQWRNLSTMPIGTATVPSEYLPARYRYQV